MPTKFSRSRGAIAVGAAVALAAALLPAIPAAAVGGTATDWMSGKYGLAEHYLAGAPGQGSSLSAADWNTRVNGYDVTTVANQVRDSGASWFQLTVGQISGHFAAPNSVYDSIVTPTAAHPSRLSTRDLVKDLGLAMHARGLKFLVYFAADPPRYDTYADGKLSGGSPSASGKTDSGLNGNATFQANWIRVIKNWSQQWGTAVDGYWIDGAYWAPNAGYYNDLAVAARTGNPAAVIAMNPGFGKDCTYSSQADFTARESGATGVPTPGQTSRFESCAGVGQQQVANYAPLQGSWGAQPTDSLNLSNGTMISETGQQTAFGGAVTWDVGFTRSNGVISSAVISQLGAVKAALALPAQRIRVVSTGLEVNVGAGSLANGAQAIAWSQGTASNQRFRLIPTSAGYVRIAPLHSGKTLAVYQASTAANAVIGQYPYTDDAKTNDEWLFESLGAGQYRIKNRLSGLYLTQPAAAAGTQFVQTAWANSDNQKFILVP